MKIVSPQILHKTEAGGVMVGVESAAAAKDAYAAYAYSTEIPVAVLGAKYPWARGAGLISAT
jgi:acyl-CoA synthetase (NDP forming)